jgi:hypothetical protein
MQFGQFIPDPEERRHNKVFVWHENIQLGMPLPHWRLIKSLSIDELFQCWKLYLAFHYRDYGLMIF